ncbi:MAG: substrate-binding domain-containing protein [Muribaculaceae bacterium]|nr:substrate-binding domain-containing protein [Muribaculaceae bacterium]
MKTHYYILLLLAGLLFFSCSEETQKYRIGISEPSVNDWRTRLNKELTREALFHDDVIMDILSADDDTILQIDNIRSMIENNYDAIIVDPIDSKAITPIIREAWAKGIPVVVFNTPTEEECWTAFHGADNKQIGQQVGLFALSEFGTSFNILEIMGIEGVFSTEDRRIGFEQILERFPNVHILARGYANWDYEDARKLADSLLRVYPHVDLIFAHNDRMALGASEAARSQNRNNIQVYGIDGTVYTGIQAVADGKINATFLHPSDGEQLLRTAIDIVTDKPYTRVNLLPPPTVVTSSNANMMILQDRALQDGVSRIKLLKTVSGDNDVESAVLVLSIVGGVLLITNIITLILLLRSRKRRKQD